jgi:uncharacterized membrane protein YgcG
MQTGFMEIIEYHPSTNSLSEEGISCSIKSNEIGRIPTTNSLLEEVQPRLPTKQQKVVRNITLNKHNQFSLYPPYFRIARESAAPSPEPAEPEVAVKTLDDYLQEKAAKALKLSLPKTRAANAGADDSKWKDTKVLEVEEATDFIKMGKDSVAKSRKGKKEGKVLITDIDLRFTEPAREPAPRGAFRGGRGGDRGGRGGRGGARGGRGSSGNHISSGPRRSGASVNVDDTELFPSLGSQ